MERDWKRIRGSVQRVTVLEPSSGGGFNAKVLYSKDKARGRKKGTRGLRTLDRLTRRVAEAHGKLADVYLVRHNRSNKKKDGWLRDLGINVAKASQKALKTLRPEKVF